MLYTDHLATNKLFKITSFFQFNITFIQEAQLFQLIESCL